MKQKTLDLSQQVQALGGLPQDTPTNTVVITGYAELTPLGNTEQTAAGELHGNSGAKKYDVQNFRTNIAAPVDFHPEDYFSEKELRGVSHIGAMGIVLAREAGRMAHIIDENGKLVASIDPRKAGCTISSGIGAATTAIDIYTKIHWKKNPQTQEMETQDPKVGSSLISPFAGLQLFPEETVGDIEAALGLQGWSNNSAEACATGLSSVVDAYQLIKSGKNDIVFAGGVEDTLSQHGEVGIGVFAAMRGPLSARNDEPEKASRPFDKDRDGFVLAAGGGVIILESLESALKRNTPIHAVILNAEKGSDGGSPTNLNTKRVAQLILKTLQKQKDIFYPVDAIFAHATSTKSGDAAEIETLRLVFGDHLKDIPITALKSMHGHLAGGAGAINIISAIRAITKGFVPYILNLDNPDEQFKDLYLVREKPLYADFMTALVLAYGFHGKDAAVILGRYDLQ